MNLQVLYHLGPPFSLPPYGSQAATKRIKTTPTDFNKSTGYYSPLLQHRHFEYTDSSIDMAKIIPKPKTPLQHSHSTDPEM